MSEAVTALPLVGVDFTSAPSRRKPITWAMGEWAVPGAQLKLTATESLETLQAFEQRLAHAAAWLGAFDFPFGLPRGFVQALSLGQNASQVMAEVQRRCATRMDFRALVDAWGNTQPAGQRLLHRSTDALRPGAKSTSPLQTRYVPVGFMWFEGFSRLCAAGVHLPGLKEGDRRRVALEGYPGWVVHELIGQRAYKNEASAERLIARKDLVDALEQGRWRGVRLRMRHAQREALVADASGDRLDAVLCLMQAAWASTQPGYGQPAQADAVEGWIAAAPVA